MKPNPIAVIERLQSAWNAHDLEALAACLSPDFRSVQPVHPNRTFQGPEQVLKNYSIIFHDIPDFHAAMLGSAVAGDTVWTEWHWFGNRLDSTRFDLRGIIVFTVEANRIKEGRMYMEPVQENGANADTALKNITQGAPQER